jgi:hypothetical protein
MAYIEQIVHNASYEDLWRNDMRYVPTAPDGTARKGSRMYAKELYVFVANDPSRQRGVVISEERNLDRGTCILDYATHIGLYPADEAWELFELHRRML